MPAVLTLHEFLLGALGRRLAKMFMRCKGVWAARKPARMNHKRLVAAYTTGVNYQPQLVIARFLSSINSIGIIPSENRMTFWKETKNNPVLVLPHKFLQSDRGESNWGCLWLFGMLFKGDVLGFETQKSSASAIKVFNMEKQESSVILFDSIWVLVLTTCPSVWQLQSFLSVPWCKNAKTSRRKQLSPHLLGWSLLPFLAASVCIESNYSTNTVDGSEILHHLGCKKLVQDFFHQQYCSRKVMHTRWFKVTFLPPSWRSLNHLKGSLNHPKQVTSRIAR